MGHGEAKGEARLAAGPGRDVPVLGMGRDKAFFYNPGPSHIIQSITRAHPIPTFGFPVPSHPMTGMGPGRDGTSRATDIPSLCFWPVPNPLIG